jgi:hypothetical protein
MPERVIADGIGTISSYCWCGGEITVPNKGLGRAKLAAWETRHQHRREDTERMSVRLEEES